MNLQEYYDYTKASPFIWSKHREKLYLTVPTKGSTENMTISLSKVHRPFLVVGDSGKFKSFLKLMLARDYQPNQIRMTSISTRDDFWRDTSTALSVLPNVRNHVIKDNSIGGLLSYLDSAVEEIDSLLKEKEHLQLPHLVYLFGGVVENILAEDCNEEDRGLYDIVKDKLNKLIGMTTAGGNVSVFFFEENFNAKCRERLGAQCVDLCFATSYESSKEVLGTDIAGTLRDSTSFYMFRHGVLLTCEVPCITEEEYRDTVHTILSSR